MNLYDTAILFKNQLIDKLYIINTEITVIYIRTFPKNLLHLTGMQRAKELCNIHNSSQFYYDCINNKYTKDILNYSYHDSKERNLVHMKVSNFDKIQNTILTAPTLYYTKDKNKNPSKAISVSFVIKNKGKYLTIVFKQDKESEYYVPVSIQLDQNLSYGVISTANKQETITSVQMLDYLSPTTQNIIKSSR